MKNNILLTLLLIYISIGKLKAQGCSDAGVCSISIDTYEDKKDNNSPMIMIKNEEVKQPPSSIWEFELLSTYLGSSYEKGNSNTIIQRPSLGINMKFHSNIIFNINLPYVISKGDITNSNNGIGDIDFKFHYILPIESSNKWSITMGFKLPTGSPNSNYNDFSLPMEYQTGLGTWDILLGAGWSSKYFIFSMGYQQPLSINRYSNYFIKNDKSNSVETYNLKRKGDVSIQGLAKYNPFKKFNTTAGLVAIYHLGEDERNNFITNKTETIKGSDGLTLNIKIVLGYDVTDKLKINYGFASPIIYRDIQPDGLKRFFVQSFGVNYFF